MEAAQQRYMDKGVFTSSFPFLQKHGGICGRRLDLATLESLHPLPFLTALVTRLPRQLPSLARHAAQSSAAKQLAAWRDALSQLRAAKPGCVVACEDVYRQAVMHV